MLRLVKNLGAGRVASGGPSDTLVLSYDQRVKGRLKAKTEGGRDVGLFLERGKVLANLDLLEAESGERIQVLACNEELLEARIDDATAFAKCCYHLGNRHVPIDIQGQRLRMKPDHILSDMLGQLGMNVSTVKAPFNPEQGAYAGAKHGHRSHEH